MSNLETKDKKIVGLSPDQFYQSIDLLHKKVKKLNKIIFNYFGDKEKIYTKYFFAAQFINGEVHDITDSVKVSIKDLSSLIYVLKLWFYNKEDLEFVDDIFKIEIEDNIFLFQYFRFKNTEDGVIAGYFLKNNIGNRILLFNISNSRISESSKTIMEYFNNKT